MTSSEIKNKLKEILKVTPLALKESIQTGFLTKTVDSIQVTYSLNSTQVATLENNLFLVFLGLTPVSDLQPILVKNLNLPEDTVLNILDDLASVLIKDDILQSLLLIEKTMKEDVTLLKNEEKKEVKVSIDKEIKEAEEVLSSINHVRTMSSDKEATKETVHVSSQFDLFGRKDKKGSDSEETRWGTDK